MSSYFPAYLNLNGRRCAVIGGGLEAERQTQLLLEHGAHLTIISPKVTVILKDLVNRGLVDWESRGYQAGDLDGVLLAFTESDDPMLCEQVALEAELRSVLLNVAEMPSLSSFSFHHG